MATAPTISEANLSPGGGLIAPPVSKKPVYAVQELTSVSPQRRFVYHRAASAGRQPKHLLFGALANPRLRILKPIPVEISHRQGSYIAKFKAAGEFGHGSTVSLALDDLGKTLSQLYLGLSEQQDSLGPDLKNLHAKLSFYIALRR
jgi:hypothetical protein